MKRIESLDYLRGLMALSVMIYHYASWSLGPIGGEYLLGKLGIYAVSMFYILSGLSLGLVYYGRVNAVSDVGSFFIKRIFRIFPLFWLVVTAYLAAEYAASIFGGKELSIDPFKVFLNYSLLFGFIDPAAYFNVGAWSIGNEMVFYAILPLLFLLAVRSSVALPLAMILSVAVGVYFAVFRLDSDAPLAEQWSVYINPFNQLFLFLGGVLLGVYGRSAKVKTSAALALLAGAFSVFYWYPAVGDNVSIVTGAARLILSFSCIAFVAGLYFWNPVIQALPAKVLGFFGTSCYSIYLLHPIVAKVLVPIAAKVGVGSVAAYTASAIFTLIGSWIVFRCLESPMMRLGKKVATAFERKRQSEVLT